MALTLMDGPNPLAKPLKLLMRASKRYLKEQQDLWDLQQAEAGPGYIDMAKARVENAELQLLKALKQCPGGSDTKIKPRKKS